MKYNHKPIDMVRVGSVGDIRNVGQFAWVIDKNGQRSLVVAIPSLSAMGWSITTWTIDHKNHWDAQWSWDGDEDKPTLKPSLNWVNMWHGYVTKGQLVEA